MKISITAFAAGAILLLLSSAITVHGSVDTIAQSVESGADTDATFSSSANNGRNLRGQSGTVLPLTKENEPRNQEEQGKSNEYANLSVLLLKFSMAQH